jgi:hypothetical protein
MAKSIGNLSCCVGVVIAAWYGLDRRGLALLVGALGSRGSKQSETRTQGNIELFYAQA